MSYRKLDIWQLARELTVGVHRMTIEKLPKFGFIQGVESSHRGVSEESPDYTVNS